MRTVVLRGLRTRARRFIGTFLAVFLGVAFLAGTLVLGDTLKSNFDDLLADANAGTDVVVRSATDVQTDDDIGGSPIPASVLDTVRAVDGVAAAEAQVSGYGQIVSADGDLLGGNGPPTIAGNWITDPELNPYRLAEGRAPERDDEVVINRGAAKDGDLHVGDTIEIRVPQPVEVTLVGIATFGDEDGLGPTTYAAFTLAAAQQYFLGNVDEVQAVIVEADPGVDQDVLAARIQQAVPSGIETRTGAQQTEEDISDINDDFLGTFRTLLVVFSAIALFVASFSINNTFAIVVAQRQHESALLRALGASRRQILLSVVAESVAIGVIASAAGIAGGLGIASLLKAMFTSVGFDALPTSGLVINAPSVAIAFGVGVLVTLVAGLSPALQAGRIAPIAAMREAATDDGRGGRLRLIAGPVVATVGAALVVMGANGLGAFAVAVGALLTVIGVVTSGPLAARPAATVLGAPVSATRGIVGFLARDNARRNPRRTSRTASALMIGVGIVTLFTVFAASVKVAIDDMVSDSFTGEVAVSAGAFGGSGFSPELATSIAESPAVDAAVGLGQASAQVDGSSRSLTVADPALLARVTDLDVDAGSLTDLGGVSIAVASGVAEDEGWTVGDSLPLTFADGTTERFTIAATYERSAIPGNYVISRQAWAPHARQDIDTTVLVSLTDGVSVDDGIAAVERIAASYGSPDVFTKAEYVGEMTSGIDMALGIIYVMLALAIVIATMGIANTLSLSIHERKRELGLLRAVGQDRAGTRAMVRWESVIVAVFGTVGGLVMGTFLGWGVMRGIAGAGTTPLDGFAIPVGSLAIVLVVGALAGVLAGIRPARRAARLDILDAIATA